MKKSLKELKLDNILSLLGLVFLISACGGSSTPAPKPSDLKCPATIGDDFADYKAIDNYSDLKLYLIYEGSGYYNIGAKYCLTSDITIGSDFTTIDTFSGTFNGQGKAINNLKRTFIKYHTGILNRVTFDQPVISSILSTGGIHEVAAIVTENTGTIEKIKVNNPEVSGVLASGLIGLNISIVQNIQVTGGKITSTVASAGIVLNNTRTLGPKVQVTGMTITSDFFAGGLAAYNTGSTIINGNVTTSTLTGVNVGGIAATGAAAINNNCVSELSLSASGLVGYLIGFAPATATFSGNSFKPKTITDGTPDHWGVGGKTAATSGISQIDTTCPDLAIDFN